MNVLELFAGAGGGVLASRLLGHRTVCAVERDPYCREILLRRQEEGVLEPFPVWDDVRTFDGRPWLGHVDIVAAGFPCQPFSVAGARRAEDDERNGWPDTLRIIREVGPRFAFLENVPGLLAHGYFGTILGELAESGYDATWMVLSAEDVGAPHRRQRLWILAYSRGDSLRVESERHQREGWALREAIRRNTLTRDDGEDGDVADTDGAGQREQRGTGHVPAEEEHAAPRGAGPVADPDRGGLEVVGESEPRRIESPRRRVTDGRCPVWWQHDPADLGDTKGEPERTGQREEGSGGVGRGRSCDAGAGLAQPSVGRTSHELAGGLDEL